MYIGVTESFLQDDKLVAAPAIDVEVEMNMLLETDDPYEGRHIWKRDQDMLLSELVTRRRKEIRLVNLEIERKKAIRKIKDLGVILDKLQEFGESGRLREELSQPDNEQAGKLRRQLLLEVLDDQDAVGYCEKAISTSKVEAEELAKELEELMSPCYPASKLFCKLFSIPLQDCSEILSLRPSVQWSARASFCRLLRHFR